MLSRLAQIADMRYVKIALALFWLAPTALHGYLASIGVYMTGAILLFTAFDPGLDVARPDIAPVIQILLLALGGLWGLAAGWLRIILSSATLRKSKIFWPMVLGLVAGIAAWVGSSLLIGMPKSLADPFYWVSLSMGLVGIFLLGAAIGARALRPNPTVERDARKSGARPSL